MDPGDDGADDGIGDALGDGIVPEPPSGPGRIRSNAPPTATTSAAATTA
jgi:hypothetical protein